MNQRKYEITDIPHPRYPWLHRIRALVHVNEQVERGDLGGFVASDQNLSQEGTCWIYDQAIACEDAVVDQDARLYDGAVARDSALVSGDACMYERSVADGHSSIFCGEIKEDARIAGNAIITGNGELCPVIGGHSNVYGNIRGWFQIREVVLPGTCYDNPTADLFILEKGQVHVMVRQRKLEPPEGYKEKKPAKESRER